MIKKHIIKTFWIMGTISMISCLGGDTPKEEDIEAGKINETFLKSVKTTKAILSNRNEELTLTGKVEYDPDKIINYVSLVNGIAARTYFSLGDKVQKGQTLLDIRSADLSSLQSEAVTSESEVKIAQRELQTSQSMYEDNILSEKELLEAQAKLKQAQATHNKIQNDISVLGTNKGNGAFSIKSPMTGYIVAKNVSSGSTISTDSDPLFTVADLSTVWITANIYASNLQFVKEGMEVAITTLSYPGEIFQGRINVLSQVFDPEEKVLKARIVMSNKELKFKPEMSVVIRLKNETNAQFVSVPSDAIVFDDDRYFVIVQDATGNFKIKEIKLEGHNNKTTYIASGLLEGEEVVTKNQLLIYSGLKED
ncbi:MAG: efflux RND transporter periplasmic adaptor subunit [Prevotella sp.]|jgi:cobalt-zinc-cadmium efflux system membrane fusion protein|nr:efflux RND transporter periplasmic adaptor subunit [Prevotella sp.]